MQSLEFIMQILSLMAIVISLIFMLGIIWRVEMKLDLAYKIFFASLVFLVLAQILEFFVANQILTIVENVFYFLFSLLLLTGVLVMRNMLRNIDGEISE